MIDYNTIVEHARSGDREELIAALQSTLPDAWLQAYKRMCNGAPTNVLVVAASRFEYLFDFSSELVSSGEANEDDVQEDRVVAAHGVSRAQISARNSSRMRGFPGRNGQEDRGHFAAHAAGGGLEINLFHQAAELNRGWSPAGKVYRQMERYCAAHPGTYFFNRPIYRDRTARPSALEFGVLLDNGRLWVQQFEN